MEYVESIFDDSFAVSWIVNGEDVSQMLGSINISGWTEVKGFDLA